MGHMFLHHTDSFHIAYLNTTVHFNGSNGTAYTRPSRVRNRDNCKRFLVVFSQTKNFFYCFFGSLLNIYQAYRSTMNYVSLCSVDLWCDMSPKIDRYIATISLNFHLPTTVTLVYSCGYKERFLLFLCIISKNFFVNKCRSFKHYLARYVSSKLDRRMSS